MRLPAHGLSGLIALTVWLLFAQSTPARATEAVPPVVIGIPGGQQPPLTVLECVHASLEGNADLERERLRRDELRGQGWQALSTGLPSFDVSASWSRGRDPSFLLDESFGGGGETEVVDGLGISFPTPDELQAQTFWRSSVGSDWEINPFRIANSVAGVKIAERQHDQDLRAAEQRTIEETMNTFYEIGLHFERGVSIAKELEARREFLDISRKRFELELVTQLDTLRAAVSLANLKPAERRAKKDLRNASSRLNILMGRDAMTPLAIRPVYEVERDPLDVNAAMDQALDRPDLKSLELRVRVLEKAKGVFNADQRPYLSLNGSYGYVSRTMEDLVDRDFDFWSANVSVILPVFDGFFTKGRVDETKATIARTRKALEQARREARLEVATAIEELAAARENLEAAELNQKAAESALEQMTLRYDLGKAQYLDVLTAQSDRFSARSNMIVARFEVLAETARLKRALGIPPTEPLSKAGKARERQTP